MASQPPSEVMATRAADPHDPALNLHQRMLLVMERIGYIPKEGTGPQAQGSYKFAKVEHIKDAVRDELVRAGVMVHTSFDGRDIQTFSGTNREGAARTTILATVWGTMTFVNVDAPDDRMINSILGQGIDNQDKAISKAMTSADKYGLLNAFQIPTGEDPDESGVDLPGQPARATQGHAQQQGGAQPRQNNQSTTNGAVDADGVPFPQEPGGQYGAVVNRPPQQQRTSRAEGDRCPVHDRPWKAGNKGGGYCTAKNENGAYCNERAPHGWRPDPASER